MRIRLHEMARNLWLALAILAFLNTAWLTGAATQPNTPRDLKSIVESGVLRVAITRFDLPPFHWVRRDGTAHGMDIVFVNRLAAALNIRTVIIADIPTFDGTISAIVDNRADIAISKLSQTYDRLTRVRFSEPLITWHHAMLFNRAVVANDASGGTPPEVLRRFSHRLGVIAASAYVDFARQNFPRAQVVEIPNWDDAVTSLKQGKVDAIYRDEFEIKRVLKVSPAMNVKFGAAVITDQVAFVSVAICDTCTRLQEFINFFIAQNKGAYTLGGILAASLQEPPK